MATHSPQPFHIELHTWMKHMDGLRLVSELTIPGTHDSATGSSGYREDASSWVTTQSLSVAEQLRVGVRFLDIRAQLSGNELILMHAVAKLGLTLWDVVLDCRDFLRESPSECILFSLKKELEDERSVFSFEQAFCAILKKDCSIWFMENQLPTLDEVRGKLVLLRRFPLLSETQFLGIDARFTDNDLFEYEFNQPLNQKFLCQDHYLLVGNSYEEIISEKFAAVQKNIYKIDERKRDPNCLFMNLLSCVYQSQTPKSLSDTLNLLFTSNYLTDKRKLMGIFPCDYIGLELARLLVNDNFEDHVSISAKASPSGGGLWILLRSGRILPFGDAVGLAGTRFQDDIPVAFAVTPTGLGCWILSRQGRIGVNGDARMFGSPPGDRCYVDIASTPAGDGLLLLSRSGVVRLGNAKDLGGAFDWSGKSPRAIDITPSGEGCVVLTECGEIFHFGDSEHFGHYLGARYKDTFVDIKLTSSGRGYWVLGIDGTIHTFGDAKSLESVLLNGKVAVSFGRLGTVEGGHWVLSLDGCIHTHGDIPHILGTRIEASVSIHSKL